MAESKIDTQSQTAKKFDWSVTINFIPFASDAERQRSYELWIESSFHLSNLKND